MANRGRRLRQGGPVEPELSAVVVPVPEAEPRVGSLRAALDANAALGVPAHVTIMFPFLPPAQVDEEVLAALRQVFAAAPAFDVEFSRVDWFDEDAVWWAPEPAAPIVALTRAVGVRFGLTPYGGAHGDGSTPHLTIGHNSPLPQLRAAAAAVAAGPPVRAHVRAAVLMAGSREPGSWQPVAELPLQES
jgi:2'-5' RNA ligase